MTAAFFFSFFLVISLKELHFYFQESCPEGKIRNCSQADSIIKD